MIRRCVCTLLCVLFCLSLFPVFQACAEESDKTAMQSVQSDSSLPCTSTDSELFFSGTDNSDADDSESTPQASPDLSDSDGLFLEALPGDGSLTVPEGSDSQDTADSSFENPEEPDSASDGPNAPSDSIESQDESFRDSDPASGEFSSDDPSPTESEEERTDEPSEPSDEDETGPLQDSSDPIDVVDLSSPTLSEESSDNSTDAADETSPSHSGTDTDSESIGKKAEEDIAIYEEEKESPSEDNSPVGDTATPAKDESVPAENENTPAEDKSTPSERKDPVSADREAPPVDSPDDAEPQEDAPDEPVNCQLPGQSFRSLDPAAAEDLLDCYAQAELDCLGSPKIYMAKLTTGNRLEGIESALYQTLRDRVSETADGSVSRAEFHVPVSDLGLPRTSWTAKQLGLKRLTKQDPDGNTVFTEEALDLVAMNMEYDLGHIVNALLADCPYELYWYDKTVGTLASGYSVTGTAKRIEVTGELVFYMAVVSDYSTGEYSSIHLVDPDGEPADYSRLLTVEGKYGAAVKHAVANASAILAEKADSADYIKLSYYAEKICAMADYNDEAAAPPGLRYGNPWQIIWLFDGDPGTTVVCESYSKGLQYLCDKSSFHSDICCYSVMGRLHGENHMWNIVRMDDGNNYLVDLTNGDLGEEMNDDLFLSGSEDGRPERGYRIVNELGTLDNEYLYSAWTLDLFTTKELTLAPASYLSCRMTGKHMPGEPVRENESEPTYETDGHYDLAVYCEICGEELSRSTETIPKKVLPAPKLEKADSTEAGVALSWESVPDATGYTVYRKSPGDTKWQPLGQTMEMSWVDTTAENGVSYRYTVKATVGKASSAYADSQSIVYRWETEQSDPQKGPKTGDSSHLRFWLLLWLCSTEGLMVFIPTVHRRRQSQKTNL